MSGLTAKEASTLKDLQHKWATQTATPRQVERCMDLEQKSRAARQR